MSGHSTSHAQPERPPSHPHERARVRHHGVCALALSFFPLRYLASDFLWNSLFFDFDF